MVSGGAKGGVNTSVLSGGVSVKSVAPGGPAAKEGQILQGDRLLQVDGISLCGLTHKQAVQCLKGSGQIASLVLERGGPRTAQQRPSASDRMGDERSAVSLVTTLPGRPTSCVSATDGRKFEVKLKKNSSGLGFSFEQMESESCRVPENDLVRVKRLFPGQPAEETGAIAAGDVILAVNGKSTEGLTSQEVLHLLQGAPQEVTLILCRPPPEVLPGTGQGWQTPGLWPDKESTGKTCLASEQSSSRDGDGSQTDGASPVAEQVLALGPESFLSTTREARRGPSTHRERPRATSLTQLQDSHPHLCRCHQEIDASMRPTSLEMDVRQNCYSVCDIRRLDSPALNRVDDEDHLCHPCEPPPPITADEEYLSVNSTPLSQLPCGQCVEADSETIPLPQFCSWGVLSEEPHDNENEWEDLEEPGDLDDGDLR